MSNTYQKNSRQAQPDGLTGQIAVPEQVIVSMTEIAGSAREGLLVLAVGTGMQVMAAMFGEDAGRLCGPDGRHNPGRAGYRHGTEAGSVTLGGRRVPVTRRLPGRGRLRQPVIGQRGRIGVTAVSARRLAGHTWLGCLAVDGELSQPRLVPAILEYPGGGARQQQLRPREAVIGMAASWRTPAADQPAKRSAGSGSLPGNQSTDLFSA